MNYSRQRETVYDVLRSTKDHPSADWIYGECKKIIPNIGLATVYRNLEQLDSTPTYRCTSTEPAPYAARYGTKKSPLLSTTHSKPSAKKITATVTP